MKLMMDAWRTQCSWRENEHVWASVGRGGENQATTNTLVARCLCFRVQLTFQSSLTLALQGGEELMAFAIDEPKILSSPKCSQ